MKQAASLLRSGSILSLLTLLSRVLGLAREVTKAALLGTGVLSDAFTIAFMLPNVFRRLFAEGSIAVAFIPTFKEYLISKEFGEIRDFLCSFWTALTFIVSSAVALCIIFAPALGVIFEVQALDETVLLTRVMFPYLLFISIAAFFQGILNSVHSFVPSALAPVLLNLATIASAWLLSPFMANPARAMAAGIFIGGFLEAAIQFPFVLKRGFSFTWRKLGAAFRNPGTRKVFMLVGPTIIGMAAYQVNDVVSTVLASRAGEGVVSSLQFSLRLQELILGVFAVSIGTVLLPSLAEEAKRERWDAYNQRLRDALSVITLITIPVTAFSLSQGERLIRLLFQTGQFNESSVALTAAAFSFHIMGLWGIALGRILAPAFYAISNTVWPTIAGIISFAVNIILALALSGRMAGGGIALALSVSGMINTIFLLVFLRRSRQIAVARIVREGAQYFLKMILCSALAAFPAHFCAAFIAGHLDASRVGHRLLPHLLPLAGALCVFAVLGILLLALTKDRYLALLTALIAQKIKRRKT